MLQAFTSGADETRTRDLLRDRQGDSWIFEVKTKHFCFTPYKVHTEKKGFFVCISYSITNHLTIN